MNYELQSGVDSRKNQLSLFPLPHLFEGRFKENLSVTVRFKIRDSPQKFSSNFPRVSTYDISFSFFFFFLRDREY